MLQYTIYNTCMYNICVQIYVYTYMYVLYMYIAKHSQGGAEKVVPLQILKKNKNNYKKFTNYA